MIGGDITSSERILLNAVIRFGRDAELGDVIITVIIRQPARRIGDGIAGDVIRRDADEAAAWGGVAGRDAVPAKPYVAPVDEMVLECVEPVQALARLWPAVVVPLLPVNMTVHAVGCRVNNGVVVGLVEVARITDDRRIRPDGCIRCHISLCRLCCR